MALQVRVPTNRTIEGPRLVMAKDRLVVTYDCGQDSGGIEQGRLTFEEVLAFEYRDSTCCLPESVLPATEIRTQETSAFLGSVRTRWDEAVGWQEWQEKRGGASRFKHFTVYFDDAGCLDVVASGCQVQ